MSDGVVTALTSGFGSVADSATGLIGSLVPVVVPILGAIILVTLGIRVFKRFTGK